MPKSYVAVHHQSETANADISPSLVPDMTNTLPEPEGAQGGDNSESDHDDSEPESDYDDQRGINGDGITRKCRPYLPPGIEGASMAYEDLQKMLKPNQKTEARFDPITRERLEQIRQFIWNYISPDTTAMAHVSKTWMTASQQTARALGKGNYLAQNLRKWGRAFITDRANLPTSQYGLWSESLLENETIVQEINLHLQGIGKSVKAQDIVDFLDTPEMRERLGRTTPIHLSTAQRWMKKMGFRWANTPKGQYVDGHEREDIVAYRQNVFIPKLAAIEARMRMWTDLEAGVECVEDPATSGVRHTVAWYHDESVFYANDRRAKRWVGGDV